MPTLSRREFLATPSALALSGASNETPWYRRTVRWGQTNITEIDPILYDIPWWRAFWKRTEVQGVIINAGGIVAYYPSKFPLHHRAEFLGGRDLFGELTAAAREDGLIVLARMDSNRTAEDFYQAHPDWFARDSTAKPYRAADKYVTCVNSPYYDEYLPAVITEIIERYKPEGLTDNSWSGLNRDSICYCDNCARKFRDKTGQALPVRHDWDNPAFRQWIEWSYARRLEIWDLNNRIAQKAGGPHCLWIGMNSGSITSQSTSFRDMKEICRRAEMMLMDHQARNDQTGFQQNGETGKLVHGLLGWDKLVPESMAMYQAGRTPFRVSAKPAAEARMWMIEGFAGGIQPWWHHIAAYHEDRRAYRTAQPLMQWHKANEQYLVNRQPVASVGVVWSQRNTDFYGRDVAAERVDLPYRGITQALLRARIPYLPIHADHIDRDKAGLSVLVLPHLAVLTEPQLEAIRRFAASGGAIVASGPASLLDEWGDRRPDFALSNVLGVRFLSTPVPKPDPNTPPAHSYIRLSPELRARIDGPHVKDEPPASGNRHDVLKGFDETDILPFGGALTHVAANAGAIVPLTLIPAFPVYPPETSWTRTPKTDTPCLVLQDTPQLRSAYLAAGLDRMFGRDNLPDHGDLLANIIRWAANGRIPLTVEGRGLVDCHLYRQPNRLILHLVNLISAGTWRAPIDENIPIGPLRVRIQLPSNFHGRTARCLVASARPLLTIRNGWAEFEIKSILDHEVVVVS